ncbi:hypothetical protein TSTA_095960 [Talaromyces stipitatus ATCC 10500]|uniref:Uncharacterized protein n=1 Tax=Talaromyces stipitatus (strain ATCC 10500 / CBS 375.48 / QM 6759 / NRRL 1006) TaxID=441959 RepID=B8M3H5_TALSN|nr:uncharacterized protein TSTA_095960 [Talaromyces stipitatus ATCC 10500]EED22347.1 hypothetical protein TSTA_095960 [Talaromyces stipitatus ATCC 10500]
MARTSPPNATDDVTEIEDSPQELYRISQTRLDPGSVEALTPPSSPRVAPSNLITKEELRWLLAEVLRIQSAQPTVDGKDPISNEKTDGQHIARRIIRTSKVEYKTVNEVWDSAKYEYKIVNSTPVPDVHELDEYIFVIRKRSHEQTKELIVYIDTKSPGLRDIKSANLDADRPAIERDLLYHYLDELREYRKRFHSQEATSDDAMLHLSKLVQYLEETYAPVVEQLKLLLESQKITWDLLWALFKPEKQFLRLTRLPGCPDAFGTIIVREKQSEAMNFLKSTDAISIMTERSSVNPPRLCRPHIFTDSIFPHQIDYPVHVAGDI